MSIKTVYLDFTSDYDKAVLSAAEAGVILSKNANAVGAVAIDFDREVEGPVLDLTAVLFVKGKINEYVIILRQEI